MATKTMNVRVSGKRDILANWTSNNPVLLSGEVVQVIMTDGTLRHKTGNGTNTFTQLPYDDEIAAMPKWFSDTYDINGNGMVDKSEGQIRIYNGLAETGLVSASCTTMQLCSAMPDNTKIIFSVQSGDEVTLSDLPFEAGHLTAIVELTRSGNVEYGGHCILPPGNSVHTREYVLKSVDNPDGWSINYVWQLVPFVTFGTEELTPGTSPLADGVVYLQYE